MVSNTTEDRSLHLNSYFIPGLTVFLILLQIFSPFTGWVILTAGFGGYWLFGYIWANSLRKGLQLEREMRFGWMQVGDHIQERLSIENDSWLPAIWVRIIDHSKMPGYTASKVASVRSQWYSHWFTRGICNRRGIYTLGPTSLEAGDPFRLYTVRIDYHETVTMMVVPPVVSLPRIEIAPGERAGEGKSTSSGLERTIVAGGVREYVPGDSLRWIHWPTTARKNTPYVRVFDYSPSSNWWVLLDMDPRVQIGKGQKSTEEFGVILAASLVHEGLQENKMVGLITHGDDLVWHPPDVGDAHLWKILRSLAVIRPSGPPLAEMLNHIQSTLDQRTSLVVITPNVNPTWLNNLGLLQRKGIAPTVLLLNPQGFGGAGNPSQIQDRMINMGIRHYDFSDTLQDLIHYQREDQDHQAGRDIRSYTDSLNQQSVQWRTIG